jgi:MFS family permease
MPPLLAPLAARDFRRYFWGQVLSSVGSGLHTVALGWYLLERTGSATDVALVWTATWGAGLVALPLSGPLADRYSRRFVCIGADLARLATVGALAGLAFAGNLPLWVVYTFTFVVGFGHSVFWPAITALLQEIIRPDQVEAASGLVEVTFQVGTLTGAAFGGPVLIQYGLGWALTIDAATYAVSAIALLSLHHRPAPREHHAPITAMVREGLAYLRSQPIVAGFGVVSVMPWVATICLNVVSVAYVLQVMHRSATVYGLGDMIYGLGAVVSGFLAALLVLRLGASSAMRSVVVGLLAVYVVLIWGPTQVAVYLGLMLAAGFCSSAFRVMANSVLFRVVPNEVMGRTSATFLLASMMMQVLATLAVGPLVNAHGAQGGFVLLSAVVLASLVGLFLLAPRLRLRPEPALECD